MLEISDLVKSLEDKYGISAAAAMPVAVGGSAAAAGRPSRPRRRKLNTTSF